MKQFAIRIFTFSIPILLFIISTLTIYYISKIRVDLKLNELSESRCLLMGDSQIQRLRGEIIFKKTKNIASSGEHYYFTYQKLLSLIQNKNNKIDKIILGVSVHNFAPVYNRLFNINLPEGKNSLKKYFYFIRLFDDSDFLTDFNQLLPTSIFLSIYSSPDYGGFFESINSNPTQEVINSTFDMHFSVKKNEELFSYSQRTYLYKIDSLCTDNNIDLILISTPYHTKYKEKIDANYFHFFTKTMQKLSKREHLNFIDDKIDSRFMSDANHLNKLGAKYYSKIIGNKIKRISNH